MIRSKHKWIVILGLTIFLFIEQKSSCLYAQPHPTAEAYLIRVVSKTDYYPERYYLFYRSDAIKHDQNIDNSKNFIPSINPAWVYTAALTGIYLGETLYQCCSFRNVTRAIADTLLDEKKVRFAKGYYQDLEKQLDPSLFDNNPKDSTLHFFYTHKPFLGNKQDSKRIMITRLSEIDFCSCVNWNVYPSPYVMLKKARIENLTQPDRIFLKKRIKQILKLELVKQNSG